MGDYDLLGLRVRSEIRLLELRPWRGDGRAVDLVIEIGVVPPIDPHLPSFSPAVQICPAGVRVAIPGVASYWVEAGRRVIVQPVLADEAPDIRVFLLGTVLAIVCFQRGLLPLHASAIDIGGRVLLVSGVSGAGKSTLAAAISAKGYRLLSDDLCAIDGLEGEPLLVLPAFPRVKLWHDTAINLQVPIDGLERNRAEQAKFNVPLLEAQFQPVALPPAQIVFLNRERLPKPNPSRRVVGVEALRRFDLVYRWRLGLALGHHALIFNTMARLVAAVPVVDVDRSDDFAALPALVERVLATAERPPP